ncbi:MAG: hypothetical protein ABIT83_21855 [Massilia sp.]
MNPTLIPSLRRHRVAAALCAGALIVLAWAALAPLRYPNRELLFQIPAGAAERRAAGQAEPMLPRALRLTLGVRDVLLLRNGDSHAHSFGVLRLLPGQQFRLPFEAAGELTFACSAQPGGVTAVTVVDLPDPGLERLAWRLHALQQALRYFAFERPPGAQPPPTSAPSSAPIVRARAA